MSFNSKSSKRAAEDYVRTNHDTDHDQNGSAGSHVSKKPRFDLRNPSALAPDAPESDNILEADVIGARGQQVRRGAVNIDGYDSDSDEANFDARAEFRARERAAAAREEQEEEEDDMFADLAEDFRDGDASDASLQKQNRKKRAVRFLDENEIEGQVKNSRSGGHVSLDDISSPITKGKQKTRHSDSSSDSDVDDETRANPGDLDAEIGAGGKKLHAPKLDAFNMRTENEEGRFDEEGNYVRKATDPDAVHDSWLEGVSKKEMKRAKAAHDKREDDRRRKAIENDTKPTGEVLKTLIELLRPGETVLEALARCNKATVQKPAWKQKKKLREGHKEEKDAKSEPSEERRRQQIEAMTEAADLLLSRGQPEIYDVERELLTRQYRKETGEDWVDDRELRSAGESDATTDWEYRWSDSRDEGNVHGPFDGQTMQQWNNAGYFGEGVEFRRLGGQGWTRVAEFV